GDVATGKSRHVARLRDSCRSVAISSDGAIVAVVDYHGRALDIFDVASPRAPRRVTGARDRFIFPRFLPQRPALGVFTTDGTQFFRETGEALASLSSDAHWSASPDGRSLAWTEDDALYVRDLASGRTQSLSPPMPTLVAMSDDGARVAAATTD